MLGHDFNRCCTSWIASPRGVEQSCCSSGGEEGASSTDVEQASVLASSTDVEQSRAGSASSTDVEQSPVSYSEVASCSGAEQSERSASPRRAEQLPRSFKAGPFVSSFATQPGPNGEPLPENRVLRNEDVAAAGLQVSRHRFPQLIEDGLNPEEHLRRALCLEHPIAVATPSTEAVRRALSWGKRCPDLNEARRSACEILEDIAKATAKEDEEILQSLHPEVRQVLQAYSCKKLAFMREVIAVARPKDDESVMHLAIGLPM